MGQKITEYPQVDYWVKLTREADKTGAHLPHRDSADKREIEKFGDMQRARYRSSFSISLPASMLAGPHADDDEAKNGAADTADAADDDEDEETEGEEHGDSDAESA